MKIQAILAMIAMAAVPAAMVSAQNAAPPAPATYTFSCDSASPLTLTPVSFNFGVQAPTTTGSGSSGAGAGKVTFSTLTVKFRIDKAYAQLLQDAESGKHYSACTLTETTHSLSRRGGAGTVFTWDFLLVIPTNVTVIGSDASNTDSGGADVPTGYVEAGFEYGALNASVSP